MNSNQIERRLSWYEKHGDNLVGEYVLDKVSLSELQKLFKQQSEDLMLDCYPVLPSHVNYLQKSIRHKINLELYDYFIESFTN